MAGAGGPRRGSLGPIVAIFVAQLLLAADCVDGKTPDCSDAAAQCGPFVGDANADANDSSITFPDANDAASDAPADAADEADAGDLDAGDEI